MAKKQSQQVFKFLLIINNMHHQLLLLPSVDTPSSSSIPDSGLGSPSADGASTDAPSYSGGLIGSLLHRSGVAKVTNSVSDTVQQGMRLKSLYQIPLAGKQKKVMADRCDG